MLDTNVWSLTAGDDDWGVWLVAAACLGLPALILILYFVEFLRSSSKDDRKDAIKIVGIVATAVGIVFFSCVALGWVTQELSR